jgi:hypothetical protein
MPFTKLTQSTSAPPNCRETRSDSENASRPRFNSHLTSDRLREGSGLRPHPFAMISNIRKDRKSIFKEVGLEDDFNGDGSPTSPTGTHTRNQSMSSEKDSGEIAGLTGDNDRDDVGSKQDINDDESINATCQQQRAGSTSRLWYSRIYVWYRRPRIKAASSAPPSTTSGLHRLTLIALLIAIVFPGFSYNNGRTKIEISGADAGLIVPRDTSPVDVCKRWAHQGKYSM